MLSNTNPCKTNVLGFSRQQLIDFLSQEQQAAYHATQILQWIHQRGITDFDKMTDLKKSLRTQLNHIAEITAPTLLQEQTSQDGTKKWLFQFKDLNAIETVFLPEEGRGTLCISSQAGCTLNCSFCATGKQGFNRNLSSAEIIGQVWLIKQFLQKTKKKITNIVFMGMGEPLYNFDNVVTALKLFRDDYAYGFSKRRVTISTAGVIPAMEKLKTVSDCSIALSLHAPNNSLRNQLVPLNKKYPLETLMETCKRYFPAGSRRQVLFEYVLLADINDQDEHAHELAKLLKGTPNKINLIPFNPFPQTNYQRPKEERIERFSGVLHQQGIRVLLRKTKGEDIAAACGQLVGQIKDRTRRSLVMPH